MLPVTPDGYHVMYHALKDLRPSSYHSENAAKNQSMHMGELAGRDYVPNIDREVNVMAFYRPQNCVAVSRAPRMD